ILVEARAERVAEDRESRRVRVPLVDEVLWRLREARDREQPAAVPVRSERAIALEFHDEIHRGEQPTWAAGSAALLRILPTRGVKDQHSASGVGQTLQGDEDPIQRVHHAVAGARNEPGQRVNDQEVELARSLHLHLPFDEPLPLLRRWPSWPGPCLKSAVTAEWHAL